VPTRRLTSGIQCLRPLGLVLVVIHIQHESIVLEQAALIVRSEPFLAALDRPDVPAS
jgi:hypothetical protein